MALYAFDGTWNSDRKGAERDTNVVWFRNAYRGRVEYQKGVGTRLGRAGNVAGGISGAGGRSRVKKALEALERNFRSDRTIDVVGFSRGAALALHFANQIEKRWARRTIRFLGLWDTVPSFGVPGSPWNIGWDLDLPDNVQTCFHALALDERRRTFALHRLEARVADVDQPGRLFELWFRGVHSDVGGGNHNPGLSSISLNWMFANAAACGVDLDDAVVDENRRRLDPDRAISPPPGYAKLPGGRRIVRWNDQVHASVTVRSGAKHNNPPTGIVRVDDSGEVVGKLAVPADSRRRRRRPRRG
jgi:uncharacterized protein (DUF2235 family)